MIEHLPEWAGTAPQWGMFVALVLAAVRLVPVIRQQTFDHSNNQVKQYEETCKRLRDDVSGMVTKLIECEKKCDEEIKVLHEEIFGLRRQHIQEQVSLINAIVNSVDAPELKTLLRSMESVQMALVSSRNTNPSRVRNTNGDEGADHA